jgi:glycosyltransferase involved in cell wall biosynthesis
MCTALAVQGHDVTLYATGTSREEQPGIYRTRIFPMEFPPLAISTEFARALREIEDVDLVHIHMLYRFPQAAAAAFCRKYSIPYTIQPHGSLEPMLFHKRERRLFKRLYEALVENRNLDRAAGVIYTAQGEADAARFLHLRPPEFIVPLGMDLALFDQSATGFRDRYRLMGKELVVWMGRLVSVKGLDVLITAFAALARQRPNVVLALIGPDNKGYTAALRRLMAHIGLMPERVIFTGPLQGYEKLAALKEADVFVLPSYTENFALAAVEAMAMGTPVIVSKGLKTAIGIAAAGAGLVVSPEVGPLQEAIATILDDGELRARMGFAARRFAEGLDWSVVVGKLEDAYRMMINA